MLSFEVCDSVDVMAAPVTWSVKQTGSFDLRHLDHFGERDCSFSVATSWGADEPLVLPLAVRVLVSAVQRNYVQLVLRHDGHRGVG